ncbi:MAG: hypothetical protein ABIV43_03440 [Candidatus Saccharimonadales bacterium]
MSKHVSLIKLIQAAAAYSGSWQNVQLAQDVKVFLWATYDANDDLIYPTIKGWDDLLAETIEANSSSTLTKDEVLSVLFGIIHRNRIVEGLWWAMFERGVTQKLLQRLLIIDTDERRQARLKLG